LAALLALAFAPLFFAIANLARASFTKAWEQHSRSLGRAIAAHVNEARAHRDPEDLEALLEAQLGEDVGALGLYDADGRSLQRVGAEAAPFLPDAVPPNREQVLRVTTSRGPAITVVVPSERGAVAALLHIDSAATRVGPLVQLIALYIGLLGLALLFVVYVMMTRIVVRPIERLSRAAGKVAEGGRELELEKGGARELVDLGVSLARMTGRLRAEEEQLREHVDEIAIANEDLQRAQDTLVRSERLASVGRLAAGLAHEIGNPISAILSFQELVLDGELDDDQREFVMRMKRETERVNRILRDLLDFARPAAKGVVGHDEEGVASAKDAIEQVVALVGPQKSLTDVELDVSVDSGLPAVAMHASRVEQVLLNLVLNAADVVPKPGGRIRISAEAADGGVRIAIEDNGGGVVPSVRNNLFEPFVTTKDVGKGTGLGLAVCRGLVESAGGAIDVEDGEEGARFVVMLPGAKEETE
jgi:signal transduction histidine kinase